jgi:uncharacterized protein (TIGR00251 family)
MFIHLKVSTDCKREVVVQKDETHFAVSLKEPAENNLANKRILEIFKNKFSTTKIRIIKGQKSPSKLLEVL